MPVVCGEGSGCVCTGVDAAAGFSILSHTKRTAHNGPRDGTVRELPCRREFQQLP